MARCSRQCQFLQEDAVLRQRVPLVERVVGGPFTNIADMARASLREVCQYLDMTVSIVESSAAYRQRPSARGVRVIDTCRAEGASDYVSAIGGRTFYSPEAFLAHGIRLALHQQRGCRVPAVQSALRSSLSIVDLLMLDPAEKARELLTRYQLA